MSDDGTPSGDGQQAAPAEKTFTQADVDKIIQDRLARVKQEPPADYEDLKAKAAKLDDLEAANQSELDKLIARAETAEKTATEAQDKARQSDIRSAVIAAATTAGAVDPDAVLALLPNDAVTVGDDGQVTGAEDAVTGLLESKPYLVGQAAEPQKQHGSADGGARGSGDGPQQLSRSDLSSMTPEQIVEADNNGQLADLYAGNS